MSKHYCPNCEAEREMKRYTGRLTPEEHNHVKECAECGHIVDLDDPRNTQRSVPMEATTLREATQKFLDAVAKIDFSSLPGAYDSLPWSEMDEALKSSEDIYQLEIVLINPGGSKQCMTLVFPDEETAQAAADKAFNAAAELEDDDIDIDDIDDDGTGENEDEQSEAD